MRISSSSIFSPCNDDVDALVNGGSLVKSGAISFFLDLSEASVIKLKLDMLELSEGLIVVLDKNGFRLFSFEDGAEISEGFSFLLNIGGVKVSKFENGKIETGVVVDDEQIDEQLASVFNKVLFDEEDEDVDKL